VSLWTQDSARQSSVRKIPQIQETDRGVLTDLKNAPVDTAWAVLQQLRSSPNPSAVLRSFKWGPPNNPNSERHTAPGTLPPVQSDLDFELMVNNSEAYPMLDVPDGGVISEASFSVSGGSPGLDLGAVLGTPTSTFSWQNLLLDVPATTGVEEKGFSSSDSSPSGAGPSNSQPALLYYDARLSNLDIAFWTTVPCSNHVAADAISMYLEINHPMMGLFDVDLFIDDLISHSFSNCSPFLVNSLMAFTMVSVPIGHEHCGPTAKPTSTYTQPRIPKRPQRVFYSKTRLPDFGGLNDRTIA
jgi:hypothetical protein